MAVDSWALFSTLISCKTLRTLYVWGPPGIGKTYGAYTEGLGSRKLYAVTMTEDTPAAELRGFYMPKGGDFVWNDGPAVMAMRSGGRLVINEVSHAGPDVRSILYGIMESPETSRLTLPSGETVTPKEGFQVFLTDNCPPDDLPDALQNRFDATIQLTEPSPKALNTFPANLREIVVKCARDEKRRISLRSWEVLSRLMSGGLDIDNSGIATFGEERWASLMASIKVAMGKSVAEEERPTQNQKQEDMVKPVDILAGPKLFNVGSVNVAGKVVRIPLSPFETIGLSDKLFTQIVSADGMVREVFSHDKLSRQPVSPYPA